MSILFPTDLSEQSVKTFEYAMHFAKMLNMPITLMHVYPIPMAYPSLDETRTGDISEELITATEAAHAEKLNQFAAALKAKFGGAAPESLRIGTELRMGFVGDEVIHMAASMQAAYVIIGVKHTSGLKRFLGGSDVSTIVRRCHVPVITVPENYTFKPIEKIAYATDLTFSDNEVINRLLDLSAKFDAHVKCFHVHDSKLETENAIIHDFIEQYKSEANHRRITFEMVDNISITDGIDYYVKTHDIDMLAVLKQKTYWLEIFETSITKKMVYHEDVPMLIYHE